MRAAGVPEAGEAATTDTTIPGDIMRKPAQHAVQRRGAAGALQPPERRERGGRRRRGPPGGPPEAQSPEGQRPLVDADGDLCARVLRRRQCQGG